MQEQYKAMILDSNTDEHKIVYVEADSFKAALQKVYVLMNDDDILCEIRKVD